jgi:hypothetical protein
MISIAPLSSKYQDFHWLPPSILIPYSAAEVIYASASQSNIAVFIQRNRNVANSLQPASLWVQNPKKRKNGRTKSEAKERQCEKLGHESKPKQKKLWNRKKTRNTIERMPKREWDLVLTPKININSMHLLSISLNYHFSTFAYNSSLTWAGKRFEDW